MEKLGHDVCALGRLLEELETCLSRQKEQLDQLKVRMEAGRGGWCLVCGGNRRRHITSVCVCVCVRACMCVCVLYVLPGERLNIFF